MRLPAPAPSIEAYALYLKGRHEANRLDADGYRAAIDYYSRAIAEFPDYAPPYSGIGRRLRGHDLLGHGRPSSMMPIAEEAARRCAAPGSRLCTRLHIAGLGDLLLRVELGRRACR